ncbi:MULTISPECIES: beta-ketoacyl-ACP synthase II [unclassified Streptomyces]|uniref:beta-ketoacyl-ACP synthase II n=1 Tax=unclassified Streptomyces TaxID=2593676 RepID=UPI0038288689
MNDEVVITGIGALTPVGNDRESSWEAMVAGRSGIAPITAFDTTGMSTRIAGEVKSFQTSDHFDTKRTRRISRFTAFAVVAAREAVADAKLSIDEDNRDRVAVVVNAGVAGFDTIEAATRQLVADREPSSYFVPYSLANMPSCEVAIDLGVHGPVNANVLACASGLYALMDARRLILSGEADVVVCGGTDAGITPVFMNGLSTMGALSRRNDDPVAASRPFDVDREGFVLAEGAVVMVLESAEHARRRGATPYATVSGAALTCDAFHVSAPSPSGEYATAAIRTAVRRAEVAPDDIDYVCAHGTSTKANDRTETKALRAALGAAVDRIAVSSPKSTVGHLVGGAGALGAMVCALAIRDGVVPPTINLNSPDPECDLDHVPNVARRLPVRTAMANAFGFGGQNCVVVFTAPDLP